MFVQVSSGRVYRRDVSVNSGLWVVTGVKWKRSQEYPYGGTRRPVREVGFRLSDSLSYHDTRVIVNEVTSVVQDLSLPL